MSLDLSTLPVPAVVERLDFEDAYEQSLANFRAAMGPNWNAELESEPVVKVIEEATYQKLRTRARINDAGKSLLLAYAKGSDLDHLAANVNLKRLVLQAEDLAAVPPVAEAKERDDAFKERIQLAFEGLTTAGPRSSYILHARNASAQVGDASVESPKPAEVVITVLALEGTGEAGEALLATVAAAVTGEDVRPLGDRVSVQSAEVLEYRIDAVLHMTGAGPENEAILSAAKTNLAGWINPRRRLGVEVARSAIDAQLHIQGVARVDLIGWSDLKPTSAQAAYCTGFNVRIEEPRSARSAAVQ